MKIVVQPTPQDAARIAARQIVSAFLADPTGNIGLATGSSPQALYEALAALVRTGGVDFSKASGFALDEYVGIDHAHPESYHSIIDRDVIVPLQMTPHLVHVPDGENVDVSSAAARYEAALHEAGGIDVQILGLGSNGHIGFNEPGSSADSLTRKVVLTRETREANSRFFDSIDEVPTEAVTQGIATILRARSIVLLANGSHKASAVRDAVEGAVTTECPGSFLQSHPEVTFYLDAAAASLLSQTTAVTISTS